MGISLETLAHILTSPAGAPVIDKTGLTGSYDIHLSFASADRYRLDIVSVFTAVQEQLGLGRIFATRKHPFTPKGEMKKLPTME